jgi:outer membrane protein OmpA-like peptidoglycan-associated protein
MRRVWLGVLLASLSRVGAADPTHLGAFVGPRTFADNALLGYLENEDYHPHLESGVGWGLRVAKQFIAPWFYPELELLFVPTETNSVGNADPARVYWLEPRMQVRFELLPERRVLPFLVVGGGSPISLSSARRTFNSGITGEGYVGGGLRFDTQKGFLLRLDGRLAVQPAATNGVLAFEADFGLGVELVLGGPRKARPDGEGDKTIVAGPPSDKDEDGLPDKTDKCPDRPEDTDSFEDADGCPDIDNDNDRVLDIADKCPTESENLNGYADDDGCIDALPPDVEALRGTIEGLIYAEGETAVRPTAQKAIEALAKTMLAQPTVKIVLIGHTDDREAKAFVTPPKKGEPPVDVASIATDVSRARAEAVRQALTSAGVPTGRMVVDGVGAEEPVTDNGTAKGRLANRRVELKLFVPR